MVVSTMKIPEVKLDSECNGAIYLKWRGMLSIMFWRILFDQCSSSTDKVRIKVRNFLGKVFKS